MRGWISVPVQPFSSTVLGQPHAAEGLPPTTACVLTPTLGVSSTDELAGSPIHAHRAANETISQTHVLISHSPFLNRPFANDGSGSEQARQVNDLETACFCLTAGPSRPALRRAQRGPSDRVFAAASCSPLRAHTPPHAAISCWIAATLTTRRGAAGPGHRRGGTPALAQTRRFRICERPRSWRDLAGLAQFRSRTTTEMVAN